MGKDIYQIPWNTSGVYMITCLTNKKRYVGSSKNISKRLSYHFGKQARSNNYSRNILYKDIGKYCIEDFKFEVLEECSHLDLLKKEKEYINKLQPEYNIRLGGRLSNEYSESEHGRLLCKKMSERAKKLWKNPEHRDKIRKILEENNLKLKKKCVMIDKNTNEKIKEFNSLKSASEWIAKHSSFKGNESHICSVCRGKRKTAYGYRWQYIE